MKVKLSVLLALTILWPAAAGAQLAYSGVPGKWKRGGVAVVYSGVPCKWKGGAQKDLKAQEKETDAANKRLAQSRGDRLCRRPRGKMWSG